MSSGNKLLRVENLKTHFTSREGTVRAVDGVDFDIAAGETLGVAGESGCGKSVTAQSILRIVPKNGDIIDGRILFNQKSGDPLDLTKLKPYSDQMRQIRGGEISMIFQEPMTSFSPVHTVGNQTIEAIVLHQKISKEEARVKTLEMYREVGLPRPDQIIDAYPFNLSGGMRQRAMIAMSLVCRPSLLIADEPTTAVDVTIQAQVLALIKSLQAEYGMAIMIITHDLAVIAELADRVLIMYLGKSVEYATVDQLFYNSRHPYTKGLLASIPKLGHGNRRTRQKILPIQGSVPSPYEIPTGCLFHPRCEHAIAGLCDKEEPPIFEVEENHLAKCFLYKEHPAKEPNRE